jgi:hypothetical protein
MLNALKTIWTLINTMPHLTSKTMTVALGPKALTPTYYVCCCDWVTPGPIISTTLFVVAFSIIVVTLPVRLYTAAVKELTDC